MRFLNLYPFQSRHLQLRSGHRLHYLCEGQGEPVVMLHGNPSWSFYYRNLTLALRDNWQCLVPDHIGCGFSDKPRETEYSYSLAQRVADLGEWLDAICPAPINLIVHDWGGMIGLAWAVQHPERVRRLVILNTGAFPNPKKSRLPWPLWLARNTQLGAWLVLGLNAFAVGLTWSGTVRRLPRVVREGYTAPYNSWANRIATLKFVQTIPLSERDPGYDIVERTASGLSLFRTTPSLICWGMRDYVFDVDFLTEWQRHLPQAEVHRFTRAGHLVLEDEGEAIARLVRQFLNRPLT